MIKERIWHAEKGQDVLKVFGTSAETGLTPEQVEELRTQCGFNELQSAEKKGLLARFIDQFKDFMILVLLIAAAVSFALGEKADAFIIITIVVLNAVVGIIQENKAEESLEALKKMSAPQAKVLRNGQVLFIHSREIVPGDIFILEAGDLIPADGRLLEIANLRVEESALTGESLAVEKTTDLVAPDSLLGDRINMVFSSSMVSYGRGRAIAVNTGMGTQVGKIATMLMNTDNEPTPLQKSIGQLGKYLGVITLAICFIIFGVGLYQGRDIFEMFLIAVSLAVAAIPEGLPAVVTVVLAIGVQQLVKKHAIIRKLPAVETLGSASIICSDKTGTLTQNKMTVVEVFNGTISSDQLTDSANQELLHWATLCNDAEIQRDSDGNRKDLGDPTEIAIVVAGETAGLLKKELEATTPRVSEVPFDSGRKLMTTVHQLPNGTYKVITKGAPDVLLSRCSRFLGQPITSDHHKQIEAANLAMAERALRVLSVGTKIVTTLPEEATSEFYETDLDFLGLLGMIDPPRPEVKVAVETCRIAGIRPIMITGDHPATALAIAKELGIFNEGDEILTGAQLRDIPEEQLEATIANYSVYARVAPEDKVRIVTAWQNQGKIVAMTGDGVNDAPALKKADIGCAMGITGTDVSKQAADMILTDDNFATIVSAVHEGRGIFDNIRKAIQFLLSCNTGEIIVFFVAILMNWDSPLLPIHILWINLVTDSFPALALGMEPTEAGIMKRPPRDPKKNIFSDGVGIGILEYGFLVGVVTLIAFWISGTHDEEATLATARTMAFATLGIVQLFLAWSLRSNLPLWRTGLMGNKWMWYAFFASLSLQLAVMLIDPIQNIFSLTYLTGEQWLWVI